MLEGMLNKFKVATKNKILLENIFSSIEFIIPFVRSLSKVNSDWMDMIYTL